MYVFKVKKILKVTSTIVFVGLLTFTTGGGANPEKTLRIRGGAMQVYHHDQ